MNVIDGRIPTLEVLGVPVARLTADAALAEVRRLYEAAGAGGEPSVVAYANAHTLNLAGRDPGYADALRRAALVLNDGAGVGLAGRLKRARFPENLNGSDFNPRILEVAAELRWPVYLLGGRPGVAAAAASRLTDRLPALDISGTHDGYFDPAGSPSVAAEVAASEAGLVMVALGNPLQELWLDEHLAITGARIGVGVGAFLDFAAGAAPRAPAWMNRAGLEWVYRLARDPGRLWRRYILGNPAFLARVLKETLSGRDGRGS